MLIALAREHAREACNRAENIFGPAFFDEHLSVVADCGLQLAGPLGADREAVEIAAYLHDLSAVCDPGTLATHARDSALRARQLLAERAAPGEIVERVAGAISTHSEPLPIGSASPEAVCLSNADAAARIARPAYWLYFAFSVRRQSFGDGRAWVRDLLVRQWKAMIRPAREMVAAEYEIALRVLR